MSKRPHKEAYERPQVLRVKLVQGEMAVTGCKTRRQSTGPAFPGLPRRHLPAERQLIAMSGRRG